MQLFLSKKFCLGREIDMAGISVKCSEKGMEFMPSKESMNAFSKLRAPTNRKELQSFMGMLNTFRTWSIKLSSSTTHLRTLLQKGATWIWTSYHETEFQQIKEIISSINFLTAFELGIKTNLLVDTSRDGIGYVFTRGGAEGDIKIIRCGSIALAPAKKGIPQPNLNGLGYHGVFETIGSTYWGYQK